MTQTMVHMVIPGMDGPGGPTGEDDLVMSDTQREAAVADLRADFQRYTAACPFRPGDLVTPRTGAGIRGRGNPQIVLEVLAEPLLDFTFGSDVRETSSALYARRLDMRVLMASDRGRAAYWVESWEYEPYTGPGVAG